MHQDGGFLRFVWPGADILRRIAAFVGRELCGAQRPRNRRLCRDSPTHSRKRARCGCRRSLLPSSTWRTRSTKPAVISCRPLRCQRERRVSLSVRGASLRRASPTRTSWLAFRVGERRRRRWRVSLAGWFSKATDAGEGDIAMTAFRRASARWEWHWGYASRAFMSDGAYQPAVTKPRSVSLLRFSQSSRQCLSGILHRRRATHSDMRVTYGRVGLYLTRNIGMP
jgi:hypothetical protein